MKNAFGMFGAINSMAIDIAQFHQVFFEESFENLDTMEKELLDLQIGSVPRDTIDTIFRAAHSIKGGSATFSFTSVAKFTHVLESLLDEMRSGTREVTADAVDLLLKSVDCLRNMLHALQQKQPVDESFSHSLMAAFSAMTGEGAHNANGDKIATTATIKPSAKVSGWSITFIPQPQILQTGNEPLRMIRELEQFGALTVNCSLEKLPPLDALEVENCYLSWTIDLNGDCTDLQIREVFEWVLDECELRIAPLSDDGDDDDINAEAPDEMAAKSTVSFNVGVAQLPVEQRGAAQTPTATASAPNSGASIRVGIDKVDSLINLVGELVITQSMLGQIGGNFDMSRLERLQAGLAQLEQNTRELQESVMRIRMLPISVTFNRFPRMIRDLAQQLGKQVELTMSGENTELDKTLLEQISDPMVHLVRNAMDHGLEKAEARIAKGKPALGNVHLNAFHQGGKVVIEISDDGAGINRDKVVAKAIERGLLSSGDGLSDEQVFQLIMEPGFSTADVISDVSGRGVGMDVVKRNITALSGTIDIHSEKDVGSLFTIRLPLTLAILDGQLVRVGSQIYVVPLISIIESLQIKPSEVNQIVGEVEVYRLRDDYVPIVRVYREFNINADCKTLDDGLLAVVEAEGQKIGLMVDELLGQQQVVIKSLETNYKAIEGISGATILGDGRVALIIDVVGMIRRAAGQQRRFEAA